MISSIGSMNTSAVAGARPPGPPPPRPEEKFQELDTDSSGSLSLGELKSLAEQISEMSGVAVSAEDLLEKLDLDGNGSLAVDEMPKPEMGGFQGPPPFLADDGSVQETTGLSQGFNPLASLLSYLSTEDGEMSAAGLSLEA